jgi:hypothetical protein
MKIRLLTIGLVFFFLSCDIKRTVSTDKIKLVERLDTRRESLPVDTVRREDCHWLASFDSTLSTGDYVKYIQKNGRIKIEWGNKKFKRALRNDYDCNSAASWVPNIYWTTSEYIGLHYSCGSPCWGFIILPLNATDSVFEGMYDFDFDTRNNQVVYLDYKENKELVVENWKTGKKTRIKSKVECSSAFLGYCIDSIRIRDGNLFVRWKEFIRGKEERKETTEIIKVGQ